MRMGKVRLDVEFEYVVDLDNKNMVAHAKDALCEDIYNFTRDGDFEPLIVEEESPNAQEADIPEFLLEMCEFCE